MAEGSISQIYSLCMCVLDDFPEIIVLHTPHGVQNYAEMHMYTVSLTTGSVATIRWSRLY